MARSPRAMVIGVLCVLLMVTATATSPLFTAEDSSDADETYQCPESARQFYRQLFECLVPVDEADRCGTLDTIRQCVESREQACENEFWMNKDIAEGIWIGFKLQTSKIGLEDCHEDK